MAGGGRPLTRRRPYRGRPARTGLAWSDVVSPCNRHPDQWSTGFGGFVSASAGLPVNRCAQDDSTMQAGALTYTTAPLDRTRPSPDRTVGVDDERRPSRDSVLVATLEDIAPTELLPADRRARYSARCGPWTGRQLAGGRGAPAARTSLHARERAPLEPGEVERQDIEVYPVFARLARATGCD